MALQQDFLVKNGMVVRNTATISTIDSFVGSSTDLIVGLPSLSLNFAKSPTLDPRISFSRASGATYVGSDGYIKSIGLNQPRFDYDPANTGTSLGLLIEEQRTNLLPYSQSIGGTNWNVRTGTTSTLTAGLAPDGSQNATLVTWIGASDGYVWQYYTFSPLTAYTFSFYAKKASGSPTIAYQTWTGLVGYGTSAVALGDVYTRYTLSFTTTATVTSGDLGLYIQNGAAWVWGAQLEVGNFATSYIPTGSATATRANDSASIVGQNFNSWINQTQGTLFIDCTSIRKQSSIDYSQFLVLGGTNPNSDSIGIYAQTAGATQGYFAGSIRVNGNGTGFDSLATQGTPYTGRAAFAYKLNDANLYTNGSINQPTGVPTALPTVNNLLIFGQASYQPQPSGWVRKIAYWPQRLPNSQLQQLTTGSTFTGTNFVNLAPRTAYIASTSNFNVQQGVVVRQNLEVPDIDKYYVTSQLRTGNQPSLNLNFLKGQLDPRITFSRASGASYIGPDGYIKYVTSNVPRFNYSSTSTGTCLGLLIEEQRINYYTNFANAGGGTIAINGGTAIGPDGFYASKFTISATSAASFPSFGYGANPTFSISSGSSIAYTFTGYVGPSFGAQQLEPLIVFEFSTAAATNFQYFTLQINTANMTVRSVAYNSFTTAQAELYSPTLTQVAGGMYKITWSIKYTQGLIDSFTRDTMRVYTQVRDTTGSGTFSTNGTCGIQYACFQTEQGAFPTSYIPTTTASATRASESAAILGQNFTNFYNPAQGTIYAEGFTSPGFAGFSPVTTITDSSYSNNYIGQYQYTGLQGATIRWGTNIQLGDPLVSTPTSTGTLFKLATVINPGNYFSATAGAVSPSTTDRRAVTSVDRLLIGTSNGGWINSTLRRVIYYPTALSTATLQALTSSTYI
jgi:hypothetical protein